jgi:hypothetical protein
MERCLTPVWISVLTDPNYQLNFNIFVNLWEYFRQNNSIYLAYFSRYSSPRRDLITIDNFYPLYLKIEPIFLTLLNLPQGEILFIPYISSTRSSEFYNQELPLGLSISKGNNNFQIRQMQLNSEYLSILRQYEESYLYNGHSFLIGIFKCS